MTNDAAAETIKVEQTNPFHRTYRDANGNELNITSMFPTVPPTMTLYCKRFNPHQDNTHLPSLAATLRMFENEANSGDGLAVSNEGSRTTSFEAPARILSDACSARKR